MPMQEPARKNPEPDSSSTPLSPAGKKRFKMLACEILTREACLVVATCEHIIDVEFLRKGLHDAGKETMSAELQKAVNRAAEEDYDAILMAYGRCSDGVVGLRAGQIPLVIPRAHDCITLFLGSSQAYEKYFSQNPGTYFRTTGWTEHNVAGDDSVMSQLGLNRQYDEYVAKYGKENADYIIQTLGSWGTENYNRLAYIDMGFEVDDDYAELARREAQQKQWEFDRFTGDMRLLKALVGGSWGGRDFLVVPPGATVAADDTGQIITAVTSSTKAGPNQPQMS